MTARARRPAVHLASFVGATVMLACTALAVTAPSSAASVARSPARTIIAGPGDVQAQAAAIAEASDGRVLWSRDLNTERPIGSITKVMTAVVVIEAGDLDRPITVPAAVVGYVASNDASTAGLRPGDTLTATQLLAALLLPSGSDAAYTLATAYGPGIPAFVAKMNATAAALGLTRTRFSNFDGLPYPSEGSNYSTAADLITLGRFAMLSAVFRSIVDQRTYRVAAGAGHHSYVWHNTDPLLGVYPGAIGIKTGYTQTAGHCLLFEATRDGRSFIGVTLDSPGVGTTVNGIDPTRLLNWAFGLPSG
ncbi:MAG: D-alanyl-D-alanine carboxypeptidase family protein [Streptosporangiaceae bacterium]